MSDVTQVPKPNASLRDLSEAAELDRARAIRFLVTNVGLNGAGQIGLSRQPLYCQQQIRDERTRLDRERTALGQANPPVSPEHAISDFLRHHVQQVMYNTIIQGAQAYEHLTDFPHPHERPGAPSNDEAYQDMVRLLTATSLEPLRERLTFELHQIFSEMRVPLEDGTGGWRLRIDDALTQGFALLQKLPHTEDLRTYLNKNGETPEPGSPAMNPPGRQILALWTSASDALGRLGDSTRVDQNLRRATISFADDQLEGLESSLNVRVGIASRRLGVSREAIHEELDQDWPIAECVTGPAEVTALEQ